ncbi:MAG TPA: flagellar hook capping FlgD N-terminal domain-containing protein [Burkholderiaceae bacterium]|nr:flagellar hook capping FlgD N-terminal domain-containing protein [Burkholderiaceae bacterium]
MQTTMNPVANNGTSAASDTGAVASAADQALQLFTTLLVAQVKNQDPLAPTDPSQFVNQLTQQTQMEALQKLAAQGSATTSMLQSLHVLSLGGQVGSDVAVATDHVTLSGSPVQTTLTLDVASARTSLVLTGSDGVGHRVALGSRPAGAFDIKLDPEALGLPPGRYALRVEADGGAGSRIEVHGTLASVRLAANNALVAQVGNVGEVTPDSITQFNGRPGA